MRTSASSTTSSTWWAIRRVRWCPTHHRCHHCQRRHLLLHRIGSVNSCSACCKVASTTTIHHHIICTTSETTLKRRNVITFGSYLEWFAMQRLSIFHHSRLSLLCGGELYICCTFRLTRKTIFKYSNALYCPAWCKKYTKIILRGTWVKIADKHGGVSLCYCSSSRIITTNTIIRTSAAIKSISIAVTVGITWDEIATSTTNNTSAARINAAICFTHSFVFCCILL